MNKQTFLKSKITNFIILLQKQIPANNKLIHDMQIYKNDLNAFIQLIIALTQYAKQDGKKYYFEREVIAEYLLKYDLSNLSPEILNKINAYFNMFVDIINS